MKVNKTGSIIQGARRLSRFYKVLQVSRRFRKVQRGSRTIKQVQEVPRKFKNVKRGFKEFQDCSDVYGSFPKDSGPLKSKILKLV